MATPGLTRTRDLPLIPGPRPGVDLAPLTGTWVNFDEGTTGIVRLEVQVRDGALWVQAWGSGSPALHDWGEVAGDPFTDGVSLRAAVAFRAQCDLGFARVMLACYLNKRLLVVDAYSSFVDGSGRASCFQRDHFYIP